MTVISCQSPVEGTTETPEVWRCDLCHCFHLRAGQVLMVFTPREFAAFTNEVVDCYCVQTLPAEISELDFFTRPAQIQRQL